MDRLRLPVKLRTDMSKGRKHQIRREGYTTGSVYGHDSETIPIEVKVSDLFSLIKASPSGARSIFDLEIEGASDKNCAVVIKDVARDHLLRKVVEISFQRISMDEKVHVDVPIELVGHSPDFVSAGGIIEQTLERLQITCLPDKIPAKIEVDVSTLEPGGHVHVSDISLPPGVELLTDPEMTVVITKAPSVRRNKAAA